MSSQADLVIIAGSDDNTSPDAMFSLTRTGLVEGRVQIGVKRQSPSGMLCWVTHLPARRCLGELEFEGQRWPAEEIDGATLATDFVPFCAALRIVVGEQHGLLGPVVQQDAALFRLVDLFSPWEQGMEDVP